MMRARGGLYGRSILIGVMKKSKDKAEKPKPIKVEALRPIFKG